MAVGVFGTVLPTSWDSVAAAGYRRRVEGLVRSAQRLSGLLEVGAGAARLHEQEIEATRSALAGGGPMPV